VATRSCPTCGTELPVSEGYVTWCHACGWNVTAPARPAPRTRFERLTAHAGRKLGDRLANELAAADRLEPRLTAARAAAYAIAAFVHLLALGLVVGGVALGALAFPNVFAIVFGVIMVGAGVMMRPRFGKEPDEDVVLRSEAPTLYAVADEVARALDTAPVTTLVVDADYNASWAVVGLRRRRILSLGLPLLSSLAPQERVALVAHELAHARNGDSSRGLFVGSAVRALAELYYLVSPERIEGVSNVSIFERVVNVFFWLASRPLWWLLMLELHLLLRDSQRAEYLADALAARVAGTTAAVSLQEKLLLEPTFRAAVQRSARAHDEDMFASLATTFASVPERERDRRRRVARLEESRLDDSHPPTARRIELLERREPLEPQVVLGDDRSAAIDGELARRRRSVQATLVDDYRDSLYYG
jgi:Zn-dependent protease with chaperone function